MGTDTAFPRFQKPTSQLCCMFFNSLPCPRRLCVCIVAILEYSNPAVLQRQLVEDRFCEPRLSRIYGARPCVRAVSIHAMDCDDTVSQGISGDGCSFAFSGIESGHTQYQGSILRRPRPQKASPNRACGQEIQLYHPAREFLCLPLPS
jgi:hypothetical protein